MEDPTMENDRYRLDDLSRALGNHATRRGAFGALVTAAGLAAVVAAPVAAKRNRRKGNRRNRKKQQSAEAQPPSRLCDVCLDGCRYGSLAEALAGTQSGGVITICAGNYPTQVTIDRS